MVLNTQYRLPPRQGWRRWLLSIIVLGVALAAPVVVWVLSPQPQPPSEPVVLGTGQHIVDTELRCQRYPTAPPGQWWCGTAMVSTFTQPRTDEPERDLRRSVRALGLVEMPDPSLSVHREGNLQLLVDPYQRIVGMSREEGEEHIMAVVDFGGPIEQLWQALGGSELPKGLIPAPSHQLPPQEVQV